MTTEAGVLPNQMLIRASQLAGVLNISRKTLWCWTCKDVRVRSCVFRRGYYSVAKLRAAGLIT